MIIEQTQIVNLEEGSRTVKNVEIGRLTRLGNFINLYGCKLGADCDVGHFVEITKGVIIGARCKIESLSFICDGVTIGNDCNIGHGVMFINDTFPDGKLSPTPESWKETNIGNDVWIGANSTILPVDIGDGSIILPGTVVTHDIPSGSTVAGNPAHAVV